MKKKFNIKTKKLDKHTYNLVLWTIFSISFVIISIYNVFDILYITTELQDIQEMSFFIGFWLISKLAYSCVMAFTIALISGFIVYIGNLLFGTKYIEIETNDKKKVKKI